MNKNLLSEAHTISEEERPTADLWKPQWLVDEADEIQLGIARDDGCYVVLAQQNSGAWRPMTHIPIETAKMIGRLAGG